MSKFFIFVRDSATKLKITTPGISQLITHKLLLKFCLIFDALENFIFVGSFTPDLGLRIDHFGNFSFNSWFNSEIAYLVVVFQVFLAFLILLTRKIKGLLLFYFFLEAVFYYSNVNLTQNHKYLLTIFLLLLSISEFVKEKSRYHRIYVNLIFFQIIIVYFYAAIAKINWQWLNGFVLKDIAWYTFYLPPWFSLEQFSVVTTWLSRFIVGLEFLFIIGLLWQKSRNLTIAMSFLFHLVIYLTSPPQIQNFSLVMFAILYLFIRGNRIEIFSRALLKSLRNIKLFRKQISFHFDGILKYQKFLGILIAFLIALYYPIFFYRYYWEMNSFANFPIWENLILITILMAMILKYQRKKGFAVLFLAIFSISLAFIPQKSGRLVLGFYSDRSHQNIELRLEIINAFKNAYKTATVIVDRESLFVEYLRHVRHSQRIDHQSILQEIVAYKREFGLSMKTYDSIDILTEEAIHLFELGRYLEAYQLLKKFENKYPYLPSIYLELALIAQKINKPQEAHRYFLQAITLRPLKNDYLKEYKRFIDLMKSPEITNQAQSKYRKFFQYHPIFEKKYNFYLK